MAYLTDTDEPSTTESRPMSAGEVRNAAHRLIADARNYDEAELSPRRAKATKYYQGQPFGNEEEGRSQFVLTDLRDTVRAILPSLLRVFFGAERAVEYQPRQEDDVPAAEQATDYVNGVVLQQDNPGFLVFYAWFKDALVRNIGIVKYWWEDQSEIQSYQAVVSVEQLELLASDPGVDLSTITDSGLGTPGAPSYAVEYRQRRPEGRARLACVPPDEFLRSRDARSLKDAALVAHRCEKTSSELLQMGIPEETIREHGGLDHSQRTNEEEQARRRGTTRDEPPVDWANTRHTYVEAYPYLDVDGDGYAELRKLACLGPGHYVVNGEGRGEPWDERPFAILIPDPEPHTLDGQGVSDWTMDLQLLGSSLIRSILDSLALSIYPRTAYVEGEVNVEDVLTTKIGAPIRTARQPDLVIKEFSHEFAGAKALPLVDVIARIKESRVGPLPARLDPDALQSSTGKAVSLTASAAHEQIELIARVFAETGVKDLFKGLLKLLNAYQPQARLIRLRNQFVPVDPRAWDAGMDVSVNVALGAGLVEEKLTVLAATAMKQEQILQTLGPSNPLVTLGQYRHTLARMLELQGFKDVSRYWSDVPPEWRPPPAPPQPDPNQLIAQAEMAKAQASLAKQQTDFAIERGELYRKMQELELKVASKADELRLREEEIRRVDDRERDKLEADIALRSREMEVKYSASVDAEKIRADLERERADIEAKTKVEVAKVGKKVTLSREK